ncbi:MAG: ABC transporter permease [Oscillospiraceae bacterium]|nr:ABC transporter permease [Oscillospiraceae bacterium]
MKRTLCFAKRNLKEIVRDPISAGFGIVLPITLLILLTIINSNIPKEAQENMFEIRLLAPGIGVFGLSFIALFAALLISKDRSSSFMLRLYTSPMTGGNFILGYALPLLPMGVVQLAVCFAVAIGLGLPFSVNLLACIAVCLPIMVVNIAIGLICGTLLNEKAVGGLCGALLTNVTAWLSGCWFSLDLLGAGFRKFAYVLPFANAVDAARAAVDGRFSDVTGTLWVVCAWAVGLMALAIVIFTHKKKLK